jgi:penicillin G amidase
MNPAAAKRFRLLASAISVILILAVLAVGWAYWRVHASLPQVDGTAVAKGLTAPVTIHRDALGVPTIRGETRIDVARALGWLHGQDRFFQIDLLRRVSAGELSEMFGKRAVLRDRAVRMHGFRKIAQAVVSRLDTNERAILEAYTAGVNAGLSALAERPFEYLVLRDKPQPWRPEDSILVIYTMAIDLQDEEGIYERTLMTLRDELGLEGLAFFAPTLTPTDAALDGTTAAVAPMPSAKAINLRAKKIGLTESGGWMATSGRRLVQSRTTRPEVPFHLDPLPFASWGDELLSAGSNAFALGGAHTATGAALLANDMHLNHRVPNIWYRASLEYAGRKITGVTLPGTPALIAGSNGQVAWGFTASYIDTSDLVQIELNSIAPSLYKVPDRDESVEIEQRHETIRVKNGDPVVVDYPWTIWGPIIPGDERKRPLALRWIAHDPAAIDLTLLKMEGATTVAEGVAIAHRAGMPAQNIVLADKSGEVAWTIAGKLPKRVGFDGRLPVTWAFGDRKWDGYIATDAVPTVLGSSGNLGGRIWSANHRHVGGEGFALLGDGAYRRAPRAAQIRDAIATLERAQPRDLLAVQLDDRALFLEPWHRLLMETLTPAVIAEKKPRAALRSYAEKWEGRASTEAVSYWLVREFRNAVYAHAFTPIFQSCIDAFPQFETRELQLEGALWSMIAKKPMHLLNPHFATWNDLLVAAADDVVKATDKVGVTFPQANWGLRNRARIRHPFSTSFPWLAQWLDMPADPLPGDADMPRAQSPSHGASERFVVSPGHEDAGIFHMPCGQSAHPMSPYFRAGHDAWVRGAATPFLPGKTEHSLRLTP